MKINRLLTISFLTFLIVASPALVLAQDTTQGHRCENDQCLACGMGEEGCIEGVCTAFICENEDKIPPVPPIFVNKEQLAQVQAGNSIRIRGVGEKNTRLYVLVDGKEVHEAAVNNDGDFEIVIDPSIKDSGDHVLELYLKDQSGNKSDKSEKLTIKFDAEAPEINFVNIPTDSSFEKILVSGSSEKGGKVEAFKDGKLITTTGVDESGIFDLLLTLGSGTNKFEIKAFDPLGNSKSTDLTISYDPDSAADIEISEVSGTNLVLSYPVGIIMIDVYRDGELVDSIKVENGSEETDYNLSGVSGGGLSNKFEFVGINSAGNETKKAEFNFTNIGSVILLVLGTVVIIGVAFFIIVQVRNGKLRIPGLKFSEQMKINLEDKTPETPKGVKNMRLITPRKEY